MDVSVHLPRFDVIGGAAAVAPTYAEVGALADGGGIRSLSVMDHFFQMEHYAGGAQDPMLEAYTTLGFLAGRTERVGLQVLVTGVPYRHPGLLAKIVASLDVLSGGRATLGIGAGWYEREQRGLGVPLWSAGERLARLEETLQIVAQMFGEDDGPYAGRFYQLEETLCSPKPIGPLPVMVGGGGERKTLRLVAQYADACNVFAQPGYGTDGVAHKLAVLREHCEDVGRPYDEIRKTILWNGPVPFDGSFTETLAAYAELGFSEVFVMPEQDDLVGFVRGVVDHVVGPAATL
ncbi:LLM class F420-dependent oxidoreductase [Mumia zhuanghuii]|uniref:LLM class F420-dependent oxidoreductase n=2 Tax=Mumia TaxID=1546255 RepID=A0ABW1QPQ5_9ACTN|nr:MULTISPECIES: LLM class F420-dependent oxidoreductase [Mumia]KAA1420381.1 LLM class F420-dependent oxidoreductase [Mumia zhuanghuii]